MAEQEQSTPIQMPIDDVKLIKETFKGNHVVLQAMQAVMLGADPTDEQKRMVASTMASKDVQRVVRNRFLPGISNDAPVGMAQDVLLGIEDRIIGQHKDTIRQTMESRMKSIEHVEHGLELLNNPDGEPIDLTYVHNRDNVVDELAIELIARNQYISTVKNNITQLWVVAENNPEPSINKAHQDSSE